MRANLIRREGTNGFNGYKPVSIVHSPALGAAQIASLVPVKPSALQRPSASRIWRTTLDSMQLSVRCMEPVSKPAATHALPVMFSGQFPLYKF